MALYPGRNRGDAVANLVADLADSVRVLRIRDGLPVTDEMCAERARNMATKLLASYDMRPLPGPYTVDFADERISPPPGASSTTTELVGLVVERPGRPIGHAVICECGPCEEYNREMARQ